MSTLFLNLLIVNRCQFYITVQNGFTFLSSFSTICMNVYLPYTYFSNLFISQLPINEQNLIFIVLILAYFCDSFAASSHNTQKSLHLVFQDVKDIISIFPLGNSPRELPPSSFKWFYFLSRCAMKLLSWDFPSLSTDTSL